MTGSAGSASGSAAGWRPAGTGWSCADAGAGESGASRRPGGTWLTSHPGLSCPCPWTCCGWTCYGHAWTACLAIIPARRPAIRSMPARTSSALPKSRAQY